MTLADEIKTHLIPLLGLKLSIARRAADLSNFQFGQICKVEGGTVGDYALHIQCSWRIEGPEDIVTGRSDLWEPAEAHQEIDWENWNYDIDENLQDKRVEALLGGYDPQTRSVVNEGDQLVVEAIQADIYGGAMIMLSGGYRLVIFPAGTQGEDWRLFQPTTDKPHFVIAGVESNQNSSSTGVGSIDY